MSGYGYKAPEENTGGPGLKFGLNSNVFLKKFEWIANGGKNNTPQEAVDIVFEIGGKEKSYRKFPITMAYGKNGEQITDPDAPEMEAARAELSQVISMIVMAFTDVEIIAKAMQQPIPDFKTYITIMSGLLPRDFETRPLDLFAQWQHQIGKGQDKTFLEIPKNTKQGSWLVAHVEPVGGSWKEVRDAQGLHYVDGAGNTHPFVRSAWFMESPFAEQQKSPSLQEIEKNSGGAAPSTGGGW